MNPWELPTQAEINGHVYRLHTDFRDILEILSYLNDPDKPEFLRWRIALALFYEGGVPKEAQQEAMAYLAAFLNGGEEADSRPGPKLLDWEQDAAEIIADVNKAAGMEIRAVKYLHWWTFLSYFHAIGEGRLSTIVSIRDKLRRGKKLEKWEQEFYRENKAKVDLKTRYTAAELAERARLSALLDGAERQEGKG